MTGSHPRALTHVGLTVPDIDVAMDWYVDIFDFEVITPPETVTAENGLRWRRAKNLLGIDYDEVRIGHLATGNQVGLEFFEFEETGSATATHPARPGFFHVGVLDPDIETLAARIDETGGHHYADVWELDAQDLKLTYCRDPWENRLEIYTQSHERVTVSGAAKT